MPNAITNSTKVEWDYPQISIRIRGIYTDINVEYDRQCTLNEIQISLFPSLSLSLAHTLSHSLYQFVKKCVICRFKTVEQGRE